MQLARWLQTSFDSYLNCNEMYYYCTLEKNEVIIEFGENSTLTEIVIKAKNWQRTRTI